MAFKVLNIRGYYYNEDILIQAFIFAKIAKF